MTPLASEPLSADRVLLVCMPMGLVQTPNLGLSLLKTGVQAIGIPCDVRYLAVEMLDRFIEGNDVMQRYVSLVDQPRLAEVCASFFAALKFGPDPCREALVEEHLRTATSAERELVAAIERAVDPFLEYCLDTVQWDQYRIIGFTSTFAGMTVPSAVLAGRVKARYPRVVTVLGGWNTCGPMGAAIAERMEEFDYVLRGESDDTFPEFVRRIFSGDSPDGLPGLARRDPTNGGVREWPQAVVQDLDGIPFPDFADYFSTMARSRFRGAPPRGWSLPFESSRGCWWGEVSHCKFCGLNGLSMAFRSKSPARVLDEVDDIVARYRPRLLFAADTILDSTYFGTVLPALRRRYPDVQLAYELKAPVKREEMEGLAEASIDQVTVGIESLSTRILRLMDKGSTFLKNVHCLRLAREVGVNVGWQYLYGFPGEQLEDYSGVAAEMPLLHHLPPPLQACRMTLARFSPYLSRAGENGIVAVRAHRDYRLSFSWDDEALKQVAYHFEFDFADGRPGDLTGRIGSLMDAAVARWRQLYTLARLDIHAGRSVAWVVDTRFEQPRIYLLEGYGKEVIEALDYDATVARVIEHIGRTLDPDRIVSLCGLLDHEDRRLVEEAEAEAERLGVELEHIPSPFVGWLPPDSDRTIEGVLEFLGLLRSLGLVICERERWISLTVPQRRVRAPSSTVPEPLET